MRERADPAGEPGSDRLLDPAGQNERTELAWSRTSATLSVALIVLARVLAEKSVLVAILLLVIGLPLALWCWLTVRGRYRRTMTALRAQAPLPGGTAVVLATLLATLLALTELISLAFG